jgi:hypothetical protein
VINIFVVCVKICLIIRPPIDTVNKKVERVLQSEWADCLRRIREDDRKNNNSTSSNATSHMATMITEITNKLQPLIKTSVGDNRPQPDSPTIENLMNEVLKIALLCCIILKLKIYFSSINLISYVEYEVKF